MFKQYGGMIGQCSFFAIILIKLCEKVVSCRRNNIPVNWIFVMKCAELSE